LACVDGWGFAGAAKCRYPQYVTGHTAVDWTSACGQMESSTTAAVPQQQQQSAPVQAPPPVPKTSDGAQVLHALLNQLAKVGFLCWLIAWALSSKSAARISSACSFRDC